VSDRTRKPLPERFWAKVNKHGPQFRDLGSCWLWTAGLSPQGYGTFGIGSRTEGKQVAHRISYELAIGPIPTGMHVDHICGRRSCVNPRHLRAVTVKQNAEHRVRLEAKNSSGFRGVAWHAQASKWSAQVQHLGKKYHLGLFASPEEAARAAAIKRSELFTHDDF
jgi:hypothetical protein